MRVLALVDFADDMAPVVKTATDLARAFTARLVLLHVATPDADATADDERGGGDRTDRDRPPDLPRHHLAATLRRRRRALHLLAVERGKLGVDTTARVVRSTSPSGNPSAKILQELASLHPDYVVIGSHGHGPVHEIVLGSVSRAIVRRSACPVLIIPNAAIRADREVKHDPLQ